MNRRFFVPWIVVADLLTCSVFAQQRYELVVPNGGPISRAERTPQRLRIEDANGNVTIYQREARFDPADGTEVGYASSVARQVIRWPANDRGRLRIAESSGAGPLNFRSSQMEIRQMGVPAVGGLPPAAGLVPGKVAGQPAPAAAGVVQVAKDIDSNVLYRLVPVGTNAGRALASDVNGNLALRGSAGDNGQAWQLHSLGSGVYRIHGGERGRRWSVAGRPAVGPQLMQTADDVDQLWRLTAAPGEPGSFILANLAHPMNPGVLAWDAMGRIGVMPLGWGVGHFWRLEPIPVILPPIFAEYRFLTREIRANPPLPPAQLELVNSQKRELWVLVTDTLQGGGGVRVKIPPGTSTMMTLERDAGATLVETYEVGLPNGVVRRDEVITTLPPVVQYDASVYEVIVQSIAIDRTVRGGKVEDVQYAPRSIGWFELPSGPNLNDGALDVYAVAKAQENPGGVRRLDPAQWRTQAAPEDPVEKLLKKFVPPPPLPN